MIRYLFHIAFKGTAYHGWQRQNHGLSVQESIEQALEQVTGRELRIHGCGRTDAGVHASQFFFHADLPQKTGPDTLFILNKNLPGDITVFDILEVPLHFNAQLQVESREYTYFVHTRKDPFLSEISSYYPGSFKFKQMQQVLEFLPDFQDFEATSITPDRLDSTISHLELCRMEISQDGQRFCLIFRGDRFIRGMVRLLTAAILESGRGKLSSKTIRAHLESGKRMPLLPPAYPQGLYLSRVSYPGLKISPKGFIPGMQA